MTIVVTILQYSGDDITMNDIPVEILLLIGLNDQETYRGMLAIPKFARAVTIGYRLNAMEKFGFDFVGYWTRNGIYHMGGNIPYYSDGNRTSWEEKRITKNDCLYIRIGDGGYSSDRLVAIKFQDIIAWSDGTRRFLNANHIRIARLGGTGNIFANGMIQYYD